MAAPVRAPADKCTAPDAIALELDDRSGAPLPMARNVTPARRGDRYGMDWLNNPMTGETKASAMSLRRINQKGRARKQQRASPRSFIFQSSELILSFNSH